MVEFNLRPAKEADQSAIRELIHLVGINPTGLDWRRFVVAARENEELLGCGQIKPHSGGVMELASIAVLPGYQGRGIGTALIGDLLAKGPRPLYLMCRSGLEPFYQRYGFQRLALRAMPAYFRRIGQMARAYERLRGSKEILLVMKLQ